MFVRKEKRKKCNRKSHFLKFQEEQGDSLLIYLYQCKRNPEYYMTMEKVNFVEGFDKSNFLP